MLGQFFQSRYRNALKSERFHIQTLRIVILCLFVLVGFLGYGLYSVPKHLTIHNPPDLRSGSTRAWWEISPSNVYAFGFYIFQQINRWPNNGEKDYQDNIERLKPFLTPACYAYLHDDYEKRNRLGELQDRVRGVYEIPGRGFSNNRVKVNGQDDWEVILDLNTDEYFLNDPVKRVLVRYPIHIVRNDVDPERNPWGLELDCYTRTPQLLKPQTEPTNP